MLTPVQLKVLKYVSEVFEANNVPYQLTGGAAAVAYGAARPTYDLDFDVPREFVPKVQELFSKYITEDYYHLQDKNFDMYLLTLVIDGVPIDVGQAEGNFYKTPDGESIRLDSHIEKAKLIDIGGIKVFVQDKEELIRYKSIMARDEDLEDIKQIADLA